jgi:glutathione S-transferase
MDYYMTMNTPTLYQFIISHFCEKVRWALDYKGIPYRACNLVPGAHLKITRRLAPGSSVPLLVVDDRVVQGSARIITLLDELVPDRPLTPADASRRGEALAWEQWLDSELGVDVRLIFYHTLLNHRDVVSRYFLQGASWKGRLFLRFGYRKLAAVMRERMGIDDDNCEKALARLDAALVRLEAAYAEREYLVGGRFSRADLAAAALVAPLFRPAGYGLDWGPTLPEPLASTAARLEPRLDWARRLYRERRGA